MFKKVLAALNKLDANDQLLHSHPQSIAKIVAQVEQIANALNRMEEGMLPSQQWPTLGDNTWCRGVLLIWSKSKLSPH
jgi:hypothetical protein